MAAALAAFAAGWLLRPLFLKNAAPSFGRVVRLTHGPTRSFGPAVSPDGKWVAYLSDARGPTDVWVQFVAGGDAGQPDREVRPDPPGAHATSAASTSLRTGRRSLSAPRTRRAPLTDYTTCGPCPHRSEASRGSCAIAVLGARFSPDGKADRLRAPGIGGGDAFVVSDSDGGTKRRSSARTSTRTSRRGRPTAASSTSTWDRGLQLAGPAEIWRVAAEAGRRNSSSPHRGSRSIRHPMPNGTRPALCGQPGLGRDSACGGFRRRTQDPVRITIGTGLTSSPGCRADGRLVAATLLDSKPALFQFAVDGAGEPPTARHRCVRRRRSVTSRPAATISSGAPRAPATGTSGSGLPDGSGSPSADDRKCAGRESGVFARRPAGRVRVGPFRDAGHLDGRRREGGTPRELHRAEVVDLLSWSPDGKEILFCAPAGDREGLYRLSVADGRVTSAADSDRSSRAGLEPTAAPDRLSGSGARKRRAEAPAQPHRFRRPLGKAPARRA